MAINDDLPSAKPVTTVNVSSSSSTSSSSPSLYRRRCSLQVATSNSATFIQFPNSARQSLSFIPVCRPRTSHSSMRVPSQTTDTQSLSNQSKLSANAPSSSNISDEHKRSHSHHRINPILNNPLLNHRKEQPKTPPIKSQEYSRTTRLCLSSRPMKQTSNENYLSTARARTAPLLAHENAPVSDISDGFLAPIEKKTPDDQFPYVDTVKYDYITRWLNEIRAATYSTEPNRGKSKRTKRRLTPTS
ncbi:unnamed protein product [Adineta ricciae]|uniref:Uncharacterized protein n=1 Tax=Adineta ricciae TaxID=249248 RepID=A0A813YI62_ADIRI|nr:unnamed protein product [Adineta ricciae]CAF1630286.1 unnamed protein product [Adineta ricciae]